MLIYEIDFTRMRGIIILAILFFLCVTQGHAQKAPTDYKEFPDPTRTYTSDQMDSIFTIGRDFHYRGDYETVVLKVPAFIEKAKKAKQIKAVNRFRSLLGNSFIGLDDVGSADAIFNEALSDAIDRNDIDEIVYSYINLGNIYLDRNADKAIEYLNASFKYMNGDAVSDLPFAIVHNNLAEAYVIKNEPSKAQNHLNVVKSKLSSPELVDRKIEFEFTIQNIQGSIYLLQGRYYRSINSSLAALEIMESRTGRIDQNYLISTYRNLIDAYDKTRQYEKLNEVRKPYDLLKNKQYEQEKIKQQQIARTLYNVDRYREDASNSQFKQRLAQQKADQDRVFLWIFSIVGFLLIILIGTLLYTRNKRNKLVQDLKIKNTQYLEAKEISEKLATKNTKFLSTISHELRTPLYGIIGLSSVFLNNKKLNKYEEEFNSLKFSADYLLSLVNDILNINKYASSKGQELKEEHFNLSVLVNSIVQTFQFLNKKNNNQVKLTMDSSIPEVLYSDKTKLSQVLMNLLSNASKFTQDGEINVSIEQITNNGKMVELSFIVADTGRGIKQEHQAGIFEEFTQVPATISEGGTGLGLPIVNKLLNILNSKLLLESTYGVGTKFSFLLPLKIGSKQELESTVEGNDIKKLDHKKLLIVDDNKINQLVTQKLLEQYHMVHDTANNGQEAVDMVLQSEYDYILMDINMPVMNGIDATIKIRELGFKTPIIALTAADDLNLERDVYSHGIDAILVKPYYTEQLLNLLIQYL